MQENNFKEERFDSFLNKIIILSSKEYFRKQMKISDIEKMIVNDENFCNLLGNFALFDDELHTIDITLELNNAIKTLSAIEQAVIFLLYKRDLSQDDAAKILEICSKSVSRIKIRALRKLRRYLEGDL